MIPYGGMGDKGGERHMAQATDPVCGMTVDTTNAPGGSYEYENVTYHFCAPSCREDFMEDPGAYLR
jgi:YHS domain-containing protein